MPKEDEPTEFAIPSRLIQLGYERFDARTDDPLFWLTPGYLELIGHSRQRANAMIEEYKREFMNPASPKFSAGPVHDEEFVSHEGPAAMAVYIHYLLHVRGAPSWSAFIAWCQTSDVEEKLWQALRS